MRATALLFLSCAAASGAPAGRAAPDMAKPPKVGSLVPYRAPARESFSLSNGVPVVLVADRRFPLVTARLAVRGGSAAVPARHAGLVSAMAELMTEGTSKRSALEIAHEQDALGGTVTAGVDKDYVVVDGFALSENAARLLGLMAEVTLEPSFPEAEVALRRRNMLEELKIQRSDPDYLSSVAFHKRLYPGHAYGAAPTEDSISRIDRATLRAAHRKLFVPANALIVVTGDIGKDRLRELLEACFGAWRSAGEFPSPPPPAPEARAPGRRLALLDRPGSAQSVLILGNAAVTEKDPDYFDLLVANQILGGSFGARLSADLRERKGFTYDISSGLEPRRSAGAFVIETQVRNEVTRPAVRGVLEHLERLRREAPSERELDAAKNVLAGRFARGLETQAGVADGVLHGLLYDLPPDYLDTYLDKVRAVTAERARRAAEAHMLPDRLDIAIVGDAAALKGQLEGLADEVKRVDVNGDELP